MSDDHNRGAYTPQSDAPLAFDARHSRGPGDRPMPVTLIVSGIVLLILVIGVVVVVMRGSSGDPAAPVTGQPIETMKTTEPQVSVQEAKPVEQQGLQIGYAEGQPLPAEGAAATTPGGPTFTPRPETPAARPPVGAPPAPPANTVVNQPLPAAQPPAPAPIAKAPAAMPAAKVEPKLASAEPKPAPKAAPKAETPKPAAGTPSVQIGAFSSASLAEQSWNSVATKVPGRIAGKTLRVEKADVDGKTYHRALIGGFSSRADADSFCAALKEQGGACTVRN